MRCHALIVFGIAAVGLFAQEAGDMDAAYQNLKAAEAKKDPQQILEWAEKTSVAARKAAATPANDDDAKQAVSRAKQVDTYTEYSEYAAALQTQDPKMVIALVESIDKRNPKSQYLSLAWGPYLHAVQQGGDGAKTDAAAEHILENDPNNPDALLVAADYNMRVKKQPEKVIAYSTKLIETLNAGAKPEGMSDADWSKRKSTMLGVAYWMNGLSYTGEGKFTDADKALRAALPYIQDNKDLLATGLFNLGLVDYKLSRGNKAMLRDALKYSQQCAAMPSAVQSQAETNVKAIERELKK